MTAPSHVAVGDKVTASFMNNFEDFVDGVWQSYTPALTAATTNPTLGTGSVVTGWFTQVGKRVQVHVTITFGTSGAAAGSGSYNVSLPVTARTPPQSIMIGYGRIKCAGAYTPVLCILTTGVNVFLKYHTSASADASDRNVSATLPGTFTNNDSLTLDMSYIAA